MKNSPLPKKAAEEICRALADDFCISSGQIDEILKKYDVCASGAALQKMYKKALVQRYMASFRDEYGKREILAVFNSAKGETEYIVLDACNNKEKLKKIERKLERMKAGLSNSALKVHRRWGFLSKFGIGRKNK